MEVNIYYVKQMILIIYFMSWSPEKLTEIKREESPQRPHPSTPKKKPRFIDQPIKSQRRVKSITKMIEKESSNFIYIILLVLWLLFIASVVMHSLQAKQQDLRSVSIAQVNRCKSDYEANRCDNPVKGIKQFCLEKKACMNEDPEALTNRTISYAGMMGQIASEFLHGLGLVGICVGIVLIWASMRQKGHTRTITTVQYFDYN